MNLIDVLKAVDERRAQLAKNQDQSTYVDLPKATKHFADAWPRQSTYTDYLRASGLYGLCPREFVLNYWQPKNNKWFDLKSQFMMGIGTHLHEYLQNCVFGPMCILKGHWIRPAIMGINTKVRVEGYHPDPELAIMEISKQMPLTWKYEEYQCEDKLYRIKGHCDGEVSIDRIKWFAQNLKNLTDIAQMLKEVQSIAPGDEALLEIKTSGSFVYKRTEKPEDIAPYYKQQANAYQKMRDKKETVFWWLNRDTCEQKVIVYPYEQGWWHDTTNRARVIWESIQRRVLPDVFMQCRIPQQPRARKCSFCKFCWDSKLDFDKYVKDGEDRAIVEGRALLDLSKAVFP